MSNILKIIIGILVVLFVASLSGLFKTDSPLGSVVQSSEYHSTTTSATFSDLVVLKSGPGALGSAVITVTGTAPMTFYDATSTVTNTEWASTTLASFNASPTVGTYTFDVIFQKGLLVDYGAGTIPTTTITWR